MSGYHLTFIHHLHIMFLILKAVKVMLVPIWSLKSSDSTWYMWSPKMMENMHVSKLTLKWKQNIEIFKEGLGTLKKQYYQ